MDLYDTLKTRDYGKSVTFNVQELSSLLSTREYLLASNRYLNASLTSINYLLDRSYPFFEQMVMRCVFRGRPCDKRW